MKVNSTELALLRSYPQASNVYLVVEYGITVLRGQVDGTHAAGATAIVLKNITTEETGDIVRGMTVSLQTGSGDNRTADAVVMSWSHATSTLTIGANSLTCTNNMYVTVHTLGFLWRMAPPTFPGTQYLPPFPCIGPARAGFVDDTFAFVGIESEAELGATISSYEWKFFGDYTLVSGSLTAAGTVPSPNVVSWATAGEKLARLKVTDSNGHTAYAYRPVLVYDRTGAGAPFSNVLLGSCSGTSGAGWSAQITLYGNADITVVPPQARIILFSEDWYAVTKGSIGGAYRTCSNILFVGYVRAGSVEVSHDIKNISFTADTIDTKIKKLDMGDYSFVDGTDNTSWMEFATLTLGKAIRYIYLHETNLTMMADVFQSFLAWEVGRLDVPRSKLWDQLTQSIVSTAQGYIGCSRYGSVTIGRDKNIITATQRGRLKYASITFTPDDWLKINVTEDRSANLSRVRVEGRLGDDSALAKNWPVDGPAHQGDTLIQSGLLFKDAAQALELAEAYYVRGNRNVKTVNLELANYRMLEPAFQESFTVYLDTSHNNRGYNWTGTLNGVSGFEFNCNAMEMNFGDGAIRVNISGEASIFGPDGVSFAHPVSYPTDKSVGYAQTYDDDSSGTN